VIWITRDSDLNGEPLPCVSIWNAAPRRENFSKGAVWISGSHLLKGWVETLWIEDAKKKYRTLPDDDKQCVVYR
jgi:hypothetical protein